MRHILVFRFSAMGDVAMIVPVLKTMVTQNHDVRITIVSRDFFKPFFEKIERVDFFSVDFDGRHKGFLGLVRLYRDLKKLKFNKIADLHNVLRTKIICSFFAFSDKKIAILDKGRAEKKALTRAKNKIFKPLKSTHQRYADVFEKLGYKVDLNATSFLQKEKLSDRTKKISGKKSEKWIGIAPFAKHQSKIYPLDLMQIVIDKLAENTENRIFLFGGKSEINTLEKLKKTHKNVIVTTEKISFTQEIQLISNLDLMLSMDSANAHISAMYGVKTIVLFGSTHPFAGFMPFGQPLQNALIPDLDKYPKLPTSVYGNKNVENYQEAMRTISPEKILEIVD